MSDRFEASALDQRFAFVDECPDNLFAEVVALSLGTLDERIRGVRAWRDALLDGRLPRQVGWPAPEVAGPILDALEQLDVARFCQGESELTDALLSDVLAAFDRQQVRLHDDIAARLKELEELETLRLTEARRSRSRRRTQASLDEATLRRLRAQAEGEVADRPREADEEILAGWAERARVWADLADVFGDLGEMMGRGWDLARGVLRHAGWLDLLRLKKLLEHVPQLRAIVRALGRLHAAESGPSVADTLFVPVRRLEQERQETRAPNVPAETRGVERSGEIPRMLPSEAALLGHPKLRMVWHARRAERSLLTYRIEGVDVERVTIEREVQEEQPGDRPRPERGPILAVIDTSGSMSGLPEQVAKAIVLEAVRTAHAEKRRCYLYAYSGPGDVLEHELDVGPEGIPRLLTFLQHSFGGGTDIGAMTTVMERLKQEAWKKADVLLVSDGEWVASPTLVAAVAKAKEDGTRFHGVQVGNRDRTGTHTLCEPVHLFRDWSAAGGWHADPGTNSPQLPAR